MTAIAVKPRILVRRSERARRLTLSVYPDGRTVLTVPPRTGRPAMEMFLRQHREWLLRQVKKTQNRPDQLVLPAGRRDYLKNRERCREFVSACLRHHNRLHCRTLGRIFIKNLYANWGSCSARGNLNFNYKIIHLPPHLAEYVVVHELCHLKEMNHSPRFWAEVARSVPDWRQRRRELRRYQL
jgi:predicted metal-dependent hydrolase